MDFDLTNRFDEIPIRRWPNEALKYYLGLSLSVVFVLQWFGQDKISVDSANQCTNKSVLFRLHCEKPSRHFLGPTEMHLIKLYLIHNENRIQCTAQHDQWRQNETVHFFDSEKFYFQMATTVRTVAAAAAATTTTTESNNKQCVHVHSVHVCGYHTPLRVVLLISVSLDWAIKTYMQTHMEMFDAYFLLLTFQMAFWVAVSSNIFQVLFFNRQRIERMQDRIFYGLQQMAWIIYFFWSAWHKRRLKQIIFHLMPHESTDSEIMIKTNCHSDKMRHRVKFMKFMHRQKLHSSSVYWSGKCWAKWNDSILLTYDSPSFTAFYFLPPPTYGSVQDHLISCFPISINTGISRLARSVGSCNDIIQSN